MLGDACFYINHFPGGTSALRRSLLHKRQPAMHEETAELIIKRAQHSTCASSDNSYSSSNLMRPMPSRISLNLIALENCTFCSTGICVCRRQYYRSGHLDDRSGIRHNTHKY